MDDKIIKRLEERFLEIGEKLIPGNEALAILKGVVEELTTPAEVQRAYEYISQCSKDMGFMGSPEFSKQQKIVEAYEAPNRKLEEEVREKAELLRLKLKYKNYKIEQ